MNRNLFFRELKSNAAGLFYWVIAISLLITVTMSVFRTFLENQSKILGMMSLIPKGVLQFKGISDFDEMLSVLGFYAVNNLIYMMLLGSIYAIVLSSNILLKEEYNKTAEYLIAWPLTRSEIYLSKLGVVASNILILNFFTALTGLICMEIVKTEPFSIRPFLILSLYTLLLNILFGATGLFMSTLIRKPKSITTASIGLVLVLYFIFTLSKITENISKIGYLSPFKYVSTEAISPSYRLEFWNLLYFIGLTLLLTGLSYRLYQRKDIYI
jgi:ABC-2 type transport system permease protein